MDVHIEGRRAAASRETPAGPARAGPPRRRLLAALASGALLLAVGGLVGAVAASASAGARTRVADTVAAGARGLTDDLTGIVSLAVPAAPSHPGPLLLAPLGATLALGLAALAAGAYWRARRRGEWQFAGPPTTPIQTGEARRALVRPWHTGMWRTVRWWTSSLPEGTA